MKLFKFALTLTLALTTHLLIHSTNQTLRSLSSPIWARLCRQPHLTTTPSPVQQQVQVQVQETTVGQALALKQLKSYGVGGANHVNHSPQIIIS